MRSMHRNRGVKTRQLDYGIGDTLVLALKVLGNGRWWYHVTLTRSRHERGWYRYQPAQSSDRRHKSRRSGAHFIPRGPTPRYRRYHRPIDSPGNLGCNRCMAADSVGSAPWAYTAFAL